MRAPVLRALVAVAAAGLLISACRGAGDGAPATSGSPAPAPSATPAAAPPAACSPVRPHAPGDLDGSIESGGRTRTYVLHVPSGYDGSRRLPLVINLHGAGSNAREQAAYSGMPAKADREGFITVSPDATGEPARWSLLQAGVDDASFIGDLLDRLERELCVDPARIYATGISSGAAMSVRLACAMPDRIAAIGPVAALYYAGAACDGARPFPIIEFHGTDDLLVPIDGGTSPAGLPVRPLAESSSDWARHNGCAPEPRERRAGEHVVAREWTGCRDGGDLAVYIIEGGGHTWPGAIDVPRLGATTHEISATDLIWEFFVAHPLP